MIRLTLSARLSLVFCALLLASSAAAAWLTIRANRLLEQENEVLRRAAAYLSQAQLPGKGSTRS